MKTTKIFVLVSVLTFSALAVNQAFADSGKSESKFKNKINTSIENLEQRFLPKGILKRIEDGKGIPPGIWKKIEKKMDHEDRKDDREDRKNDRKGTTTPPTATSTPFMLKINDINVVKATSTARINWRTNVDTYTVFRYGISSNITASSTTITDSEATSTHKMNLSSLTPDTRYFYKIIATDKNGNVKESQIREFKTHKVVSVEVDTEAPKIVFSTVYNLKATTTSLVWITNEQTDSRLWMGTTTPVDTSSTPLKSSSSFSNYHSFNIDGLATSTTYYYIMANTDKSGNTSTSTVSSFQTLAN